MIPWHPFHAHVLYTHFVNLIKIGGSSFSLLFVVCSFIRSFAHYCTNLLRSCSLFRWWSSIITIFYRFSCFALSLIYPLSPDFCWCAIYGWCWKANPLEIVREEVERTTKPKKNDEIYWEKRQVLHLRAALIGHLPDNANTTRVHLIGSNSTCVCCVCEFVNPATVHCYWHGTYCFLTSHIWLELPVMTPTVVNIFHFGLPNAFNFPFFPIHSTNEYLKRL